MPLARSDILARPVFFGSERLFKSSRARQRGWRLSKAILLLLAGSVAIFMGVVPLLEGNFVTFSAEAGAKIASIRGFIMQAAIVAWFAALGGSIGSFMNVLVWRMPRGESVLAKGSACPRCLAKIRLADNLPVIGWLRLGGRCRTCKLPISPRYPVVELIYLLLYLILFAAIITAGGANLPNGPFSIVPGIIANTLSGKGIVLAAFAFHATWLSLILSWAMFEMDGNRIPWGMTGFAVACGLLAPLIEPRLMAVGANGSVGIAGDWTAALVSGVTGIIVGAIAGLVLDEGLRRASGMAGQRVSQRVFFAVLLTSGLFTGWQATATVLAIGGLIALAGRSIADVRLPGGKPFPLAGYFAVAAIIHVCAWRGIYSLIAPFGIPMMAGLFVAGLALFAVASTPRVGKNEGNPPAGQEWINDSGNEHE